MHCGLPLSDKGNRNSLEKETNRAMKATRIDGTRWKAASIAKLTLPLRVNNFFINEIKRRPTGGLE